MADPKEKGVAFPSAKSRTKKEEPPAREAPKKKRKLLLLAASEAKKAKVYLEGAPS